jgi:Berberine and berberine like
LPPGLQQYWKANFLKELSDGQIDAQLDWGPKVPTVNSTGHIYPIDGAAHRVGPDETAFAYRDANFATVIAGAWPDPADNEKNVEWVRGYYRASAKNAEEGGYINFMSEDDQGRIEANYKGNYDRLRDVKRTYDPGNLFHLNQNIKP